MYTSQLHSLTGVIISRRAPGRSPTGDTISPPAWQRFYRSIPFLATSPSSQYLLTQAFSPRPSSCRPGPHLSTWTSPATFRPGHFPKFSYCVKKIRLETDLLFLGTEIAVP